MTNELKGHYSFERLKLFESTPIDLFLLHIQETPIIYEGYRINVEISKKQLPCYPHSVLTRVRVTNQNDEKQTTSSRAIITCIGELEIIATGLIDSLRSKSIGVQA